MIPPNPARDQLFLKEACMMARQFSRDPSTQCGCVLVDDQDGVVGRGWNSFAHRMRQRRDFYRNRRVKYQRIIHAEMRALIAAGPLAKGTTCFAYPLFPCSNCMKHLIEGGIMRVVTMAPQGDAAIRWAAEIELSKDFCDESGIEYTELNTI